MKNCWCVGLVAVLAACSSVPDDWRDMSQTEIGVWQSCGFTPKEAQQWRSQQFDGEAACAWKNAGFELDDAMAWSKEKFTADEAKTWVQTGFDLDDAVENRNKGLAPIHRN